MSDIDFCDFGLTLATSHLYKMVLTTKICISVAGVLVLAIVCGRVKVGSPIGPIALLPADHVSDERSAKSAEKSSIWYA
uniref:Transmembrane protein n=1 Tax=Steinernema glaseri TaxID=37863 RepID=A0A1I8AVA0_9BILA